MPGTEALLARINEAISALIALRDELGGYPGLGNGSGEATLARLRAQKSARFLRDLSRPIRESAAFWSD